MDIDTTRAALRARLARPEILTIPGVYDGISARAAAQCGFEALYMTGYGVAASLLGLPDAGLTTYTEMVDRVRVLAGIGGVPLIADADTGYGGLVNLERTVRGYEAAGAAAIQIEDQEFPKKCGHVLGRRVVPFDDAVTRIRVAAATRSSRDLLILARTDARTNLGLDEALRRAQAFLDAGADILFVESPETPEEMARIGQAFAGVPLLANIVEGGRTPLLSAAELQAIGFRIALFPAAGFLPAAAAMGQHYAHLRRHGTAAGSATTMLPFAEMNTLMGFPELFAFEGRWAAEETPAPSWHPRSPRRASSWRCAWLPTGCGASCPSASRRRRQGCGRGPACVPAKGARECPPASRRPATARCGC